MRNAWREVEGDEAINVAFSEAWAALYGNEDEEAVIEMIQRKLTRKIFNARCGTTFNWYKRAALKCDRVNFRSTLRVFGSQKRRDVEIKESCEIITHFEELQDDIMDFEGSTPTARAIDFEALV